MKSSCVIQCPVPLPHPFWELHVSFFKNENLRIVESLPFLDSKWAFCTVKICFNSKWVGSRNQEATIVDFAATKKLIDKEVSELHLDLGCHHHGNIINLFHRLCYRSGAGASLKVCHLPVWEYKTSLISSCINHL